MPQPALIGALMEYIETLVALMIRRGWLLPRATSQPRGREFPSGWGVEEHFLPQKRVIKIMP